MGPTRIVVAAVGIGMVTLPRPAVTPSIGALDGIGRTVDVLRTLGEASAVKSSKSFLDNDSKHPTLNVSVELQNGQTYFAYLSPDGTEVWLIRGETRTDDRRWLRNRDKATMLSSEAQATTHVEGLAAKLFPSTEVTVDDLKYSADTVQNGKVTTAGRITATLTRRYGALRFLDRTIAAGVEIDPLDKGIITYTGMKKAPPVSDLSARISRQEAIEAWAAHFGRPQSEIGGLRSILGLAVAPGQTAARPCWAFFQDGLQIPGVFIDCKTKAVFGLHP